MKPKVVHLKNLSKVKFYEGRYLREEAARLAVLKKYYVVD